MNDFVFKNDNNIIKFVGDFESLYQNENDPWKQSSREPSEMKEYYDFSRKNLIDLIETKKLDQILEVGCGLGYTTQLIKEKANVNIDGLDVSQTAINKATTSYPHLNFFNGDISNYVFTKKYQTVLFMQCLWYILHDLDNVIKRIRKYIPVEGYILFSQAFLKKQNYGTEIIDGHEGLVNYFEKKSDLFDIIYSEYNQNNMIHNDGLLLVRRKS